MKFLIIKNEADGFEPVFMTDKFSTAQRKLTELQNKEPNSNFEVLGQTEL